MDGGDEGRVEGAMEVGEYDPSAALEGDEEHEEIEYDEAEFFNGDEDDGEEEAKQDKGKEKQTANTAAHRTGRNGHRGGR